MKNILLISLFITILASCANSEQKNYADAFKKGQENYLKKINNK